jgi:hypothetical protein
LTCGSVWPGGDAYAVSGAIGECPPSRCFGVIDNPTAGGKRRFETLLGMFASDGHVDMHGMAERFGWIQLLHPNGGPMADRVNAIVVGHRRIPEHRSPEAEVDAFWLGCDSQLDLLYCAAVGTGAVGRSNCRDGACDLDMPWLELPDVSGEPYGETVGCHRHQDSWFNSWNARHCRCQPRRLDE